MTTDQDMATMPIPELTAAIRKRAPDMEPMLALLLGVLSGRLMKEYERAEQTEKDAALLAQKLTAALTKLQCSIDDCPYYRCPCR